MQEVTEDERWERWQIEQHGFLVKVEPMPYYPPHIHELADIIRKVFFKERP